MTQLILQYIYIYIQVFPIPGSLITWRYSAPISGVYFIPTHNYLIYIYEFSINACPSKLEYWIIPNYAHVNVNHVSDPRNSDGEKVSLRIPTMTLALTVRIPFQKIYISTNCKVRMSERIVVVRVPCMVRQTPVICRVGGGQDSLWQVHYSHGGQTYKGINIYGMIPTFLMFWLPTLTTKSGI